MSPIYSYAQFSFAKQELANRLFDPTKQFWSDAELGLYLQEAIRTWNALASYWRGDFTFPSVQGTIWYDLTNTTNLPNTLRAYTLFDTDLYTVMQYHLLEPAVGVNPWAGVSLQFTADDLINAVQRRRDETLSTTSCTLNRRLVPAVAGRVTLADTVIDVRRMAYLPAAGGASVVWAEDTWGEQSYNPRYTIAPAGTPLTYLLSTEPPISFDTDAPPGGAGNYELLTVEAGAALSAGTPSRLLIPDDWLWVVKWGALADLFARESYSRDPLRATYAEQRYRMGLRVLAEAPALLAMRVGTTVAQIDSVHAGDLYQTSWEAQAQGAPNTVFHAGLNMLALSPPPDVGPYSLLATVVQNAPVPSANTDFIQVGRDDLDVIIDYAQHLAAFKQGGAEFIATIPLLKRFFQQAAIYGLKLSELGEYTSVLYGLSQREDQMNPVTVPAPVGEPS